MKMPWWVADSGADVWQNQAISDLQQTQQWEDSADMGVAEQVGNLGTVVRRQAEYIARLEMSLQVLTDVLIDYEILTEGELKARYGIAADERARMEQSQKRAANTVKCASCGKAVDRSQTVFSEYGEVCVSCAG